MPYVSPRRTPILDNTRSERVPQNFWIRDSNGVTLKQGLRVWIWDPTAANSQAGVVGNWVVAWAQQATGPGTAAAAFASDAGGGGTRVNVSWTVTAVIVSTDQWRIKRPDGSTAGTVPVGTLAFSDLNPLPLNGAYSVVGVLSGVEGGSLNTNSLDLRVPPASFVATFNAGAGRVDFSGTPPAVGIPDNILYYRNLDGSYVGPCVSGTGAPCGYDGYGNAGSAYAGYQFSYQAVPQLSGVNSASVVNSNTVSIPPGQARPQAMFAQGLNAVRFLFWGPDHGIATDYQVEFSTDNVNWVVYDAHNTGGDVTYPTTTAVVARVRTNAPGGTTYSAVSGPVAPTTDVTPPGDVSWQSFKPESSYGRMVMRAVCPGDGDLGYAQIERSVNGGGWEVLWASGVYPGQGLALDVGSFGAGTLIQCRVYLRDTNGNARYSSVQSYTLTASPSFAQPSSSNYWVNDPGYFNLDGTFRPRQGYYAGNYTQWNLGFWYYGSTIADVCAGKSVWAMYVYVHRMPGDGGEASAGNVRLTIHPNASNPGTGFSGQPATGPEWDGGALAPGEAANLGIPTVEREQLQAGYATGYWGLGVVGVTKPFQVYANPSDDINCGVVTIHHLG